MARTLIALAVALVCAAPAQADVYSSGQLDRGDDGASSLEATITNNSTAGEAFELATIQLPPGSTVTNVTTNASAAPATCAGTDPGVVQCQFPPPYVLPGDKVVVDFHADPPVADGAGAGLSVCVHPCAGAYTGPFLLEGPAPAQAPLIDALASVTRWRAGRLLTGDTCTPAKPLFVLAATALCVDRNGATLRGIVVTSGRSALPLTLFGPGWTRRLRVPTSGGAGFQRKGRVKRGSKVTFVSGVDGARASMKLRLPAKLRRG